MKDLLKKSIDALKKDLLDKKAKLQDLRFKLASTRLRDDKAIKELKKEIARIKTAISLKSKGV